MVGTAIVAAASAIAGIAGGIAKTAAARRQQRLLQKQIDNERAKNDAWYNRRYNEDFLQRTENLSALKRAGEMLMRSSRAAAGTAAVQGTSNAVAAAQKEANNQTYADLVSNVASNASRERDVVENQYRQRGAQIAANQQNVTQARYDAKMAAIDTAAEGVQGAANAYLASHKVADINVGDKVNNMPKVDTTKVGEIVDSPIKTGIGSDFKKNQKANETTPWHKIMGIPEDYYA